MQVVHAAGEVAAAVQSAQRLARPPLAMTAAARALFPTARHVEVQVFADAMRHGGALRP